MATLQRQQLPWAMVSDLDIYRWAKLIIDEHGDDAALEAAMRADARLERGDLDGARGVAADPPGPERPAAVQTAGMRFDPPIAETPWIYGAGDIVGRPEQAILARLRVEISSGGGPAVDERSFLLRPVC